MADEEDLGEPFHNRLARIMLDEGDTNETNSPAQRSCAVVSESEQLFDQVAMLCKHPSTSILGKALWLASSSRGPFAMVIS